MIEERPLYSEWLQKNAKIAQPRKKEEGVFLIDFYTTVQQNLLLRVGCGYAEPFSAPI